FGSFALFRSVRPGRVRYEPVSAARPASEKSPLGLAPRRTPSARPPTNSCSVVPTARLELARLSPLPPQVSVATNFTTPALQKHRGLRPRLVVRMTSRKNRASRTLEAPRRAARIVSARTTGTLPEDPACRRIEVVRRDVQRSQRFYYFPITSARRRPARAARNRRLWNPQRPLPAARRPAAR